jgi:hypothetical protein
MILAILFTACRAGDMACPEPKLVKLNKRPANYRMRMQQRQMSASAKEDKEKFARLEGQRQIRPAKSSDSIEEWDCPKPGTKTVPKAVKENIRKNRKKFDNYYKIRNSADTVNAAAPSNPR